MPEACSSWFLPRIVGISQAMEWVATGRVFAAAGGARGGLVRSVHPADELLRAPRALAREIADNTAPVSVALARQMMWHDARAPTHPMEAHRADSRAMFARGQSADAAEGVTSFLEKRRTRGPPGWRSPATCRTLLAVSGSERSVERKPDAEPPHAASCHAAPWPASAWRTHGQVARHGARRQAGSGHEDEARPLVHAKAPARPSSSQLPAGDASRSAVWSTIEDLDVEPARVEGAGEQFSSACVALGLVLGDPGACELPRRHFDLRLEVRRRHALLGQWRSGPRWTRRSSGCATRVVDHAVEREPFRRQARVRRPRSSGTRLSYRAGRSASRGPRR